MLEVEAIDSYYGLAHILHSVCLTLSGGEAVALLGRNGAGKSTVMKSIVGFVPPARGAIRFFNQALAGKPPYRIAQAGIGYVPEERRIFKDLTVLENLDVGKRPPRAGAPFWTIEKLFSLFPNLAKARNRLGGQISGGEQQMLTIARCLMGNPALILLDEPSQGLAPTVVEQMAQTVQYLKAEGMGVLLSEQNLRFATLVSDRAYIIEKGQIRYSGTMADLAGNEAGNENVRAAYLSL